MKLKEYENKTVTAFKFMPQTMLGSQYVCNRDFQLSLELYLKMNKGFLNLQPWLGSEIAEITSNILSMCATVYESNKYRYEKLSATLSLEYNPIENYSMTEKGNDLTTSSESGTTTGKDATETSDTSTNTQTEKGTDRHYQTDIFGEQTTTDTFGEKKTTSEHGAQSENVMDSGRSTTNNEGGYTTTTEHGATSKDISTNKTTTLQTSAFNSDVFVNSEQTIEKGVDTESTKAFNDVVTTSDRVSGIMDSGNTVDTTRKEYTDTDTQGSYSDIHKVAGFSNDYEWRTEHEATNTDTVEKSGSVNSEKNETATKSGTANTEHTLTRSGNIGVTTSQQMIESERVVANFNLLKIVASDITKAICIAIYEV